ncbi:protein of unknown function [Streptococcus thermophilus]|nr:hypothetical protein Y018_00725 [Streptococcus thermophilus TH982]CAD0142427.1 protein of unknown function [Streptococcus thermophilus]
MSETTINYERKDKRQAEGLQKEISEKKKKA